MQSLRDSLVRRFSVKRICGPESERITDAVAVEEPLEIRVRYWFKEARCSEVFAVTMRTPGHDRELTAGLLFSEGVVQSREELLDLRVLGGEPSNEILAELADGVDFEGWRTAQRGFRNSSCGICGKRSLETLARELSPAAKDSFAISKKLIEHLPALLSDQQTGYSETGGLHAAALIDSRGRVEAAFEEVGRHNALDKLIGCSLLGNGIPLSNHVIFMSSRSSFELVQKAAMAGASVLATVSGASSLAIELAREQGITLIGFVRPGRFNVYSGDWRIHSE